MMFSFKHKLSKALVLGGCLLLFSTTAVWAAEDTPLMLDEPNREIAEIQIQDIHIDEAVLAKQREIDRYLGGEGKEELAQLGFKWTHTGPQGDLVEIGITPYEEQFADFLYDKFGRDSIIVVKGEQAYTLDIGVAPDQPVSNEATITDIGEAEPAIDHGTFVPANDGREDLRIVSDDAAPEKSQELATTMSPVESEPTSNSMFVYYLIGGTLIVASIIVLTRKQLVSKR